jgi:integrase
MSIHRRQGSPFWQYDFTVGGLRFRGSTETEDRETAKSIAAKLRADAVLGQHFPKKATLSLSQATERYYQEVAQHQPSGDDTDRALERLVAHFGGPTPINRVTSAEISAYVAKRRGQAWRGKLPSNATVNREVELLRRVFRRARDVWKVDIGDMPDWKAILLPEAEERTRHLSKAETARVLTEARKIDPFLAVVIEFALLTGVRLDGAIKLEWSEVNLAERVVAIRLKSRKPGGETLRIGLTNRLVVLLANQEGLHKTRVFTYAARQKRLGRLKGSRQPFTKTGWRKQWKAILKAAGVTDFRWHDLRHSAGTNTLRATRNLAVVKKLLGHRSITSTLRYAHVLNEDVTDGIAAAERHILDTGDSGSGDKGLEDQEKKAG